MIVCLRLSLTSLAYPRLPLCFADAQNLSRQRRAMSMSFGNRTQIFHALDRALAPCGVLRDLSRIIAEYARPAVSWSGSSPCVGRAGGGAGGGCGLLELQHEDDR